MIVAAPAAPPPAPPLAPAPPAPAAVPPPAPPSEAEPPAPPEEAPPAEVDGPTGAALELEPHPEKIERASAAKDAEEANRMFTRW